MNPTDQDESLGGPVNPGSASAPSDAAEPVAKKPARKRAPRKKVVEVEESGAVAPASEGRSEALTAVAESAAAALPTVAEAPKVAAAPSPLAEGAGDGEAPARSTARAGHGVEDAGGALAEGEGQQGEGGRRNRGRRRGRGKGERERPDAAAPLAAAAGDGEAPAGVLPAPAAVPVDAGELFAEVLSGAFDVEPEVTEQSAEATRRILAPEPDAPKLHKVLAQAGIGSRRDMEQWVLEGRVTVNGEPAHTGQRISFGDRIAVAGKPVKVRIAPAAAACAGVPQAGRRGGHARRPAAPSDRLQAPAAAAPRQVAVGRTARHQHRRAAAVHQLGRTGQPADASALRGRARVRRAFSGCARRRTARSACSKASRSKASARLQVRRGRRRRGRQPLVPSRHHRRPQP
jgi:23S rRNA pseudouridine2605 synthase